MYADRYGKAALNPGSLALAVALNGAIVAALVFSAPHVIRRFEPILTLDPIRLPDPPPPPDPKPLPKQATPIPQPIRGPVVPKPRVLPPPDAGVTLDPAPMVPLEGGNMPGIAGNIAPRATPTPDPVLVGAQPDSRYARDFQPLYPPAERRAEREGRVEVRVLIGVDGRVKQVERLSATSDAFFDATQVRALEKWRFKPATRDGIPVEAWRTMSVRFVLDS